MFTFPISPYFSFASNLFTQKLIFNKKLLYSQNDFTSADFANMPASLAYNMFKSKTSYPLHAAIKAHREDVVFLYLVEHDLEVPSIHYIIFCLCNVYALTALIRRRCSYVCVCVS